MPAMLGDKTFKIQGTKRHKLSACDFNWGNMVYCLAKIDKEHLIMEK